MSTLDSYGQNIPAPTLGDEPNIETLIPTVNAVVQRSVMRFQNATARAAVLTGPLAPVHGMLTDLIDEDRIDRWDGTRWNPITPGPWHAFPVGSGIVAHSGSPGYRYVNGKVEFRGRFARTGGGQFSTGTDWLIGTMPVGWRPPSYTYWIVPVEIGAGIYYARAEIRDNGQIIAYTPPGATSTTNGMKWLGLEDSSYPLDTPPATL
ncbi:hypothetical protein [Streptomyces tauricus]